jgi:hypothetical protein
VAQVALFYWFINIIIINITKKSLKAYEYYEKIMIQIRKYPLKATFDFSKSNGKHEILCAQMLFNCTNKSIKMQKPIDKRPMLKNKKYNS